MADEAAKSDTKPGMTAESRHVYGPRSIGALVPGLTRPAFRRLGAASAQVMADWEAIMGPTLAAVATPRRLASGTLTIACAGPAAMELQHLAPQLMARINTHLGAESVQRLRFVQGAASSRPVAQPPAPQRPESTAAAENAVRSVAEGPLRDALAALGRAVLARHIPRRSRSGAISRPATNRS
jgi:hypothetical protein